MSPLSDAEIVSTAARGTWRADHGGGAPAERHIPTPAALAAWLPDCPADAMSESVSRLDAVMQTTIGLSEPSGWRWITFEWGRGSGENLVAHYCGRGGVMLSPLQAVDRQWRDTRAEGTRNPLSPLIRAWWARPSTVVPFHPRARASLPAMAAWDPDDEALRNWPTLANTPAQGDLFSGMPDFAAADAAMPWLMSLYAQAGGPIDQGGRLPFDLHLFVGALVHLPVRQRDGLPKQLMFPHLREHRADFLELMESRGLAADPGAASIEEWLYPDGSGRPRRDWPKIRAGLHSMARKLLFFRYRGYSVQIAVPSHIPANRDGLFVSFNVAIPRDAAHGARLDWPRFQRYALESATLARAYLSALDHLHRSARRGMAITRELPAPVLGLDGKPVRRRGGEIVRGEEVGPNPQARFVPAIDDRMMARMCGYENPTRLQRFRSRSAFERLHNDGVLELVQDGARNSYRLFGRGRFEAGHPQRKENAP